MEPAQGKNTDKGSPESPRPRPNQGGPPERQQQRQDSSEFSQVTMVRAQPVFPEGNIEVKLEPDEIITVKEEVVEDETGSSQETQKQNTDKDNGPPENTGQTGHRRVPPPPPIVGPIRLKPKRYKYSPYEIDPKFKWSKQALPFVSRPDEKRSYAPRPVTTASATAVTSAASGVPAQNDLPNTTESRSSGPQCSTVDLSVFAAFLGKPLFQVKMPPVVPERSTSATSNQNPNVLPNPLTNSTTSRPTTETTTETTVVTGERRQPRRPKSPSLLAELAE